MVAEVKNQQKLTRANSLKKKEKKNTKASLDHAAARVVKIEDNLKVNESKLVLVPQRRSRN